ncbi:hypothetical protein HY642_02345 [Candidatus Woesearchaeota archaeon]|nr:hypothetical protein [Candidatus Woesearchaeota archaeon]
MDAKIPTDTKTYRIALEGVYNNMPKGPLGELVRAATELETIVLCEKLPDQIARPMYAAIAVQLAGHLDRGKSEKPDLTPTQYALLEQLTQKYVQRAGLEMPKPTPPTDPCKRDAAAA